MTIGSYHLNGVDSGQTMNTCLTCVIVWDGAHWWGGRGGSSGLGTESYQQLLQGSKKRDRYIVLVNMPIYPSTLIHIGIRVYIKSINNLYLWTYTSMLFYEIIHFVNCSSEIKKSTWLSKEILTVRYQNINFAIRSFFCFKKWSLLSRLTM